MFYRTVPVQVGCELFLNLQEPRNANKLNFKDVCVKFPLVILAMSSISRGIMYCSPVIMRKYSFRMKRDAFVLSGNIFL